MIVFPLLRPSIVLHNTYYQTIGCRVKRLLAGLVPLLIERGE